MEPWKAIFTGILGIGALVVAGCGRASDAGAAGAQAVVGAASTSAQMSSPPADATADWASFSSSEGAFAFRYPQGWSIDGPCSASRQVASDSPGIEVRLSPTPVHSCASDGMEGIVFDSFSGPIPVLTIEPSAHCEVTTTTVTVSGEKGTRTVVTPTNGWCPYGKLTYYRIEGHGHWYTVSAYHDDSASGPDLSSAIVSIVEGTLDLRG